MRRRYRLIIGLALLAALTGVNAIRVSGQTKPAAVTVPGARLIDVDGVRLQVLDTPARRADRAGIPIVLVHCWGCSMRWWDRLAPLIAEHHRVIRVDLLGFGGSEKPAGGYDIPDQGRLVADVLTSLGVRRVVAVGHSMGVDVVTALAERAPDRVAGLVDLGEGPYRGYLHLPFLARIAVWPLIGQTTWSVAPDFAIKDGIRKAFAPGFNVDSAFDNSHQVVDDYRRMTFSSQSGAFHAEGRFEAARPLDRRIAATGVPLLAIMGRLDQFWDAAGSIRVYGKVPGARAVILDGVGHSPNLEAPAQTASLILSFAEAHGH